MAQDNLASISKNPRKHFLGVRHWCGVTKMADYIAMARLAGSYSYLSTLMARH